MGTTIPLLWFSLLQQSGRKMLLICLILNWMELITHIKDKSRNENAIGRTRQKKLLLYKEFLLGNLELW